MLINHGKFDFSLIRVRVSGLRVNPNPLTLMNSLVNMNTINLVNINTVTLVEHKHHE